MFLLITQMKFTSDSRMQEEERCYGVVKIINTGNNHLTSENLGSVINHSTLYYHVTNFNTFSSWL